MIDDYIQKYDKESLLVATVHDSILLDVPAHEVVEMANVVKTLMENLPIDFLQVELNGEKQAYPIDADIEVGLNYNNTVEFDKELYEEFNDPYYYCNYLWDRHQAEAHHDSDKLDDEEYEVLDGAIQQIKDKYVNKEVETMFEPLYEALKGYGGGKS